MSVMSAVPSHRPVASEKIVSPSPLVCDGLIARAYPSSAISAMRVDLRLGQLRVGGDEADRRVLAGTRRAASCRRRAGSCARRRTCRPGLRTPATTLPVRGIDDVADRIDGDDGGDDEAARKRDRRGADARLSSSGPGRRTCRRSRRRRRRPSLPATGARRRRLGRLVAAVGGRPDSSGCRRRRGRTGSRPERSARVDGPAGQPMLCSSSQRTVPVAASRPNALPPARTTALTLSTMLSGFEQVGFARARRAAALRDAADRVAVDEDRRCSRSAAR